MGALTNIHSPFCQKNNETICTMLAIRNTKETSLAYTIKNSK